MTVTGLNTSSPKRRQGCNERVVPQWPHNNVGRRLSGRKAFTLGVVILDLSWTSVMEMNEPQYTVILLNGWSYVVRADAAGPPLYSGPWRYRWEAEEEADRLNKPESHGR